MRKIICLLCVLVLLPVTCFAWGSPDGTPMAFDFDFGFEMDPDAFPKEDYRTALGYSELLNRTRISGTYMLAGDGSDCFDLNLNVSITDTKTETISFHLFGSHNNLYITSPLVGTERLYMNLNGLLIIALKIHDYFGIAAQEPALLLPYATEFGMNGLKWLWAGQFPAGTNVKMNRQEVRKLAGSLQALLTEDSDFADWVKAVGIRSGFSDVIEDEMSAVDDYVMDFFPDGLNRKVTKNGETWTTGKTTIATRKTENNEESFDLLLPATAEYGLVTEIHSNKRKAGSGNDIELTAKIASDTDNWLDLTATGENVPETYFFTEPFSLEINTAGYLTGNAGLKIVGEKTGDHELAASFFRKDETTGEYRQLLRVSGTRTDRTGDPNPTYDQSLVYESVYLTALSDQSLSDLMNNIAGPFVKGILPVLVQVPTITCQVILDQLTEHGVLNLLTGDLDLGN